MKPAQAIKLYRHPLSGHCHRVELLLAILGLPYETVDLDMANGAHKAPDFLALNPLGQVPVIDDGGTIVADSNAILIYLAAKYDNGTWYPKDPEGLAEVQRWLSVAAGQIAFGPAAARLITVFGAPLNAEETIARAAGILGIIDGILVNRPYLAGESPSLADISGYSYIAHAPEGNVTLEPYPNLRAWLTRIEALPGFVPMTATKAGLAA
ncbi:glutathione S-transferase family protein [Denitrobaculum tricleocarpae]|uniref:Glutathione S-transferase n=1 Tax=Denitrobaculum tricleocarpae TaxID=2591009 RepID=A0A545TYM4_9PROT|nr:glutathione S-transferase [Denitrobaculum tricleocarpae]TQV82294.1 glutathione S-transferase [Denitrobaculum tricleocarpae]